MPEIYVHVRYVPAEPEYEEMTMVFGETLYDVYGTDHVVVTVWLDDEEIAEAIITTAEEVIVQHCNKKYISESDLQKLIEECMFDDDTSRLEELLEMKIQRLPHREEV